MSYILTMIEYYILYSFFHFILCNKSIIEAQKKKNKGKKKRKKAYKEEKSFFYHATYLTWKTRILQV